MQLIYTAGDLFHEDLEQLSVSVSTVDMQVTSRRIDNTLIVKIKYFRN